MTSNLVYFEVDKNVSGLGVKAHVWSLLSKTCCRRLGRGNDRGCSN